MIKSGSHFLLLSMNQARGLIACLFSADIVLAALYLLLFLHGNPMGNDRPNMFNMDGEGNIPSWYSSVKLLAVGLCAYFYGRLVLTRDKLAGALILLGGVLFAYLSMDEGATLHEKIGDRFNMLVGANSLGDKVLFDTTGVWMLFLGPPLFLALVGGIIFLRKRLSIAPNVFAKALTGALIFVIAAAPGDILVNYFRGDALVVQTAIEELAEMIGVTLMLWAVMTLLAEQKPVVVAEAMVPAASPLPAPPALALPEVAARRHGDRAAAAPARVQETTV